MFRRSLNGAALAHAIRMQLAREARAADQKRDYATDARARAVAPQSGENQSIDSGQSVHGDDSAAEGAPRK